MTRRAFASLFFCACVLAAVRDGSAAPKAGTLDRLADAFVSRIEVKLGSWDAPRRQASDLVVALRLGAGSSEALRGAVERLLLARLQRCGLASVRLSKQRDAKALARWARRAGFELMLRAELLVDKGYLQLRGELAGVEASLWRDLLTAGRGSLSHLYARVRADAEVRSYLGAAGRVRIRFGVKRQRLGRGAALALTVADFDGDGRGELALLRRKAVEIWQLRAGRWRRRQRIALEGRQAPMRPRRAMGALLAADLDSDGRPELYHRSSDAGRGGVFKWQKKLVAGPQFVGYPHAVLGSERVDLVAAPGVDFFRAADISWPKQIGAKAMPARFYQLRLAKVTGKGQTEAYAAAVDVDGTLHLLDGKLDKRIGALRGVGSALALLDADDDGRLEILVSSPDETGKEERVRVFRLAKKKLWPIWRSALLSGRLTSFGHGDIDGDGQVDLLAATLDERGRCWLLQLD